MSRSVSLVFVNYRTSHLLRDAIDTARRASSVPLQVIVVDNSIDSGEVAALDSLEIDELIVCEENRGFAAGLNLGASKADGELLLSANPDVRFDRGSIDALIEPIDDERPASGPRFYWDEEESWLLPPPEEVTRLESLARAVGSRVAISWIERSRARRRLDHWLDDEVREVLTLSGAVMMITRNLFHQLGGMDEGFRLYFEEVDFFRRMRRRGRKPVFQPKARCRHLFGRSAVRNRLAAEWYAESERYFHEKWHGGRFYEVIQRIGVERDGSFSKLPVDRCRTDGSSYLELSGDPRFWMAAGNLASTGIDLPFDSVRESRLDPIFVREVCLNSGKVFWSSRVELGEEESH